MSVETPVYKNDSSIEEKQLTVDSVINWQLPVLAILFVSVVFVAVKTVVHRHESRTAYVKLQKLEKERDKLAAQWSRLKLEQAVTLNQVRVEKYARWDLNMKMPKASEKKIIQEPIKSEVIAILEIGNIKVSSSDRDSIATTSKAVLGN
jgi:cell division protein FtsL